MPYPGQAYGTSHIKHPVYILSRLIILDENFHLKVDKHANRLACKERQLCMLENYFCELVSKMENEFKKLALQLISLYSNIAAITKSVYWEVEAFLAQLRTQRMYPASIRISITKQYY